MNIKRYAAAGVAIALMCMPMIASAETTVSADMQVQVQSLISQIQALQAQLKTLMMQTGSSTKPMGDGSHGGMMNPGQTGKMMCASFNRTLKPGMQGKDVKSLQQVLSQDPDTGFSGNASGFFGPLTAKAIIKFQMKNGIASSSDGTVGPMTRGFFERRCGSGIGEHGNDGHQGDGPKPPMGMGGQGGQGAQSGDHANRMMVGTISASSATSISVIGANNESKTFTINASTSIEVAVGNSNLANTGTVTDLIVGKKVMVSGSDMMAAHIRVGDLPPMGMSGQGGDRVPGKMMIINPDSGQGQGGKPKLDGEHPQNY